jgi:hypothetical protein
MSIGAPISVVTGVILDYNGNQVPDGTVVTFSLYHNGESVPSQIVDGNTSQGIARANFVIDQSGELNIRAESGQAVNSDVLTFEIPPESGTATPQLATSTPQPSPTATLQPTSTATATPQTTPIPPNVNTLGGVNFGDWMIALVVTALISVANYWYSNLKSGLRWGVRGALLPIIGGMVAYIYLAVNFPGSGSLLDQMGGWGVLLTVLIGAGLGAGAMWLWQMLDLRHIKPT